MESSSESAFKVMNQDFVKLDRFDGTNFSRWKDKMMFFLMALKIAYVLDPSLPEIPVPKDDDSDEVKAQCKKHADDELLCRGHIMNTLSDHLYDLYTAIHDLQVIVSKLYDLKVEIFESLQGHYKRECKADSNKKQKKDNAKNANLVEQDVAEIVAMISHWNIGMISELHVVTATKSCDWWYDSGATVHVCNDKSQFQTYEEVPDGHEVLMGNHNIAKVLGKGSVDLQFTSGKKLILVNVLHVPEIRKNLVSADALNKKGLKVVLESNKVIFSMNGVFVGKGYSCDGMFKLCINKDNVSVYVVDASYSLCHGYAENSKAYRLLDLDSNVIVESRDVEFLEDKFLYNLTMSTDSSQEPPPVSDARLSNNNKRDVGDIPIEGDRQFLLDKIPVLLNVEDDPKTFSEAMKSRGASFWREAINDEMDSLLSNHTWILVDLPPGSKPISCKWVFRKKYATNGSIQTFKAKLVAIGFRQKEGIDYFNTYALVARITSIRVLLALVSMFDLCVHQMDVKTAFLNGDLNEEVYMDQPEGFVLLGNEKKVSKLIRSLYGLKQAPKQWHQKFESAILSNGFKYNNADKCIFSKFTREYGVIICLYVEDMLIVGTNYKGVEETKKYLSSIFNMKDLGEVDTILRIM
ncbi:uncharacterized protein [Coffea arabica]|uniref:Reverse transcriptase Ty1/copia-type domain-containing protein n=1 Tax=Coffea arabica TaxID=13443 RepID=A0ABM4W8H4_COFAR